MMLSKSGQKAAKTRILQDNLQKAASFAVQLCKNAGGEKGVRPATTHIRCRQKNEKGWVLTI